MNKSIRQTNQRVAILEYLEGNYDHPTVENVYEAVKEKLPRIGKATVYQNLKFLENEGLVNEVDVGGLKRFEAALMPHHHIICKECGSIVDFDSKELSEFATKLAKKKGFEVESTSTNFYTICKKCKEKTWKKDKKKKG